MSGKVVSLHQLMEHEALSIETDFSYLKDTDLKAFLSTGESLSNLKTALTRGEKLLLVDKPRAPMFFMDFPKAELDLGYFCPSPEMVKSLRAAIFGVVRPFQRKVQTLAVDL